HFCAERCRDRFAAEPGRYAETAAETPMAKAAAMAASAATVAVEPIAAAPPSAPAPALSASAAEWTCPMHPEVVRAAPGSCPICGMALEPRTITLDDRNPELDDMTRRFRASLLLTLP